MPSFITILFFLYLILYNYKQFVELAPTVHCPTEQVVSQYSHTLFTSGNLFAIRQDGSQIFIFVNVLSISLLASLNNLN